MVEDTICTSRDEGEDILKGFPEEVLHSFVEFSKDIFSEFMFPLHWNATYRKEDFFDFLMHTARNRDSISHTTKRYGFDREKAPAGDTVLYHLQRLDMETVEELYMKANLKILEFVQEKGIFRKMDVQLAVDFVGVEYYGEYNEWVHKMCIDGEWMRMFRWLEVSLVDEDQKYMIYVRPVPASYDKRELLHSVLEHVYTFCGIENGVIYLDREFFNVRYINTLDEFCSLHNSFWLMPARETSRVKTYLGEEGIYPEYTMHNKWREEASFTLVVALNDKGNLRPFATNLCVETKEEFVTHYNEKWKKITDENGDLLPLIVILRRLFDIYRRRWQVETGNRCVKHPFLITTSSANMPTRDYLMRFAFLSCFSWMAINTYLFNEFGPSYWVTGRTFEELLCTKTIVPERLKRCFVKAPKSMKPFPKGPKSSSSPLRKLLYEGIDNETELVHEGTHTIKLVSKGTQTEPVPRT